MWTAFRTDWRRAFWLPRVKSCESLQERPYLLWQSLRQLRPVSFALRPLLQLVYPTARRTLNPGVTAHGGKVMTSSCNPAIHAYNQRLLEAGKCRKVASVMQTKASLAKRRLSGVRLARPPGFKDEGKPIEERPVVFKFNLASVGEIGRRNERFCDPNNTVFGVASFFCLSLARLCNQQTCLSRI
jgi:hypothetical protein